MPDKIRQALVVTVWGAALVVCGLVLPRMVSSNDDLLVSLGLFLTLFLFALGATQLWRWVSRSITKE